MEKIKILSLYSDVFRKHTTQDAENHFIIGAPLTTPNIEQTPPVIPKPWLFAKVLLLSLAAFLGFYIGALIFQNAIFLPGLILFGSIITPISLLIFFWEVNILQNISMYKLALMLVKGSIVALLCTVVMYALLDGENSPLLIGFVEETAKIITLLLLVDHKNYKFIINGMLIGAAIGTGFAAFESSGYILINALENGISAMLNTIFWRAVFAPGGHIAWAALTGAAFIAVKGDHPFRISMLFNIRFLSMYALVIVLHAIWDTDIPGTVIMNIPIMPVALTIISWLILFAMMKQGFKQVINITNKQQSA
jgi:RsiW-degrading membrane proteinase PrsW (M82 family)